MVSKKLLSFLFVFLICTVIIYAQCPMCKMAAESNMKNGGMAGRGLNQGILYLLALPYLVVGSLAFKWWRDNRLKKT